MPVVQLSYLKDKELSLINIVVGVKTNEWVNIFKNLQSDIDNVKADVNPRINNLENRILELEEIILKQANLKQRTLY